jgi:hypothetical protein
MLTMRSLGRLYVADKAGPSVTELLSAVLAFSTLVLGIGAAAYWILNEKIKTVEGMAGEGQFFARYLEKSETRQWAFAILLARPKAAALGFDAPDIRVISLSPGTFSLFLDGGLQYSSVPASPPAGFTVTCTLLRVDGDSAIFSVNGHVAKSVIEKVAVSVPLRPGRMTPIAIRGIPALYVALLDMVRPDVGVFAIGPATPKNKS